MKNRITKALLTLCVFAASNSMQAADVSIPNQIQKQLCDAANMMGAASLFGGALLAWQGWGKLVSACESRKCAELASSAATDQRFGKILLRNGALWIMAGAGLLLLAHTIKPAVQK